MSKAVSWAAEVRSTRGIDSSGKGGSGSKRMSRGPRITRLDEPNVMHLMNNTKGVAASLLVVELEMQESDLQDCKTDCDSPTTVNHEFVGYYPP